MNPRKGTETLRTLHIGIMIEIRAFGLMNPRKGTETTDYSNRGTTGVDKAFGLMNPRKGTETKLDGLHLNRVLYLSA